MAKLKCHSCENNHLRYFIRNLGGLFPSGVHPRGNRFEVVVAGQGFLHQGTQGGIGEGIHPTFEDRSAGLISAGPPARDRSREVRGIPLRSQRATARRHQEQAQKPRRNVEGRSRRGDEPRHDQFDPFDQAMPVGSETATVRRRRRARRFLSQMTTPVTDSMTMASPSRQTKIR